jgi:hypothetical protein
MLHSVCSLVAIRYFSSPSPDTCRPDHQYSKLVHTFARHADMQTTQLWAHLVELLVEVLQLSALAHALLFRSIACQNR